jgi:hypothetical protein
MPDIGDRVRVESTKVGQAPRDGVVVGVIGHLLRIKWSTGEESTIVPGPGAVAVTGRVRKSAGKKAGAPAKKTAKRATKPGTKMTVKGHLPKKRAPAKNTVKRLAPARKTAATTKAAKKTMKSVTKLAKTSKSTKSAKKVTKLGKKATRKRTR